MTLRFFEIRSPQPDFTGRVGGVSFADGLARVSFDDARDDSGLSVADENRVQVGRSAVLFARRRGYGVTEVDATGKPIDDTASSSPAPSPVAPEPPSRSAPKADWVGYAAGRGMTREDADKLTRDQLAEKYLGPKEG